MTRDGIGDPTHSAAHQIPVSSSTRDPHHLDPIAAEEDQYLRSRLPPAVRYKECMRNHAASSGRYVVDGCGEFMPAAEDGTPGALRCAACDCHRSFHRQEMDGNHPAPPPPAPHPPRNTTTSSTPLGLPPPLPPPFGEGSSSEDVDVLAAEAMQQSRKRFRTRFSKEQKDRMEEFAEKIGWRVQRQDEEEVEQFCSEIGVKRKVFRVWMHNHNSKHQRMKQQQQR